MINRWINKLANIYNQYKANLRDLIAATGLVFLLKIGFNSLIFGPMWPGNLMEDLKKQYVKLCASFQIHRWIQTGVTARKRSIWGKIGVFFFCCDLKIWRMTLKNNREHLRCYFKRCASFHSHLLIQNGVTVPKHQIWVKITDFFFVPRDLEIWRMTLKNNRAPLLCYYKLCVSFHSHLWNQKGSYSPETPNLGQNRRCFCPVWPWNLTDYLEKQ